MSTTSTTRERPPQAAAIYCRISEDREGANLGVKRQESDCRELAEKRGWGVGEILIDNDLSAWSGKRRPAYQRMLAGIGEGSFDGLICYHLDRLTRTPRELEDFFEVCDRAGLRNMATVTGDIDLGTDDGRFHARIMGAVARKESDDKSRRIRRKHVELARDGKALWGAAVPFGYAFDSPTKTLLPDGRRADEVRQMFARYSEGWSLKRLSHDLNDRFVVGARGKTQWHSSHVARMLDNSIYAGYRHYADELTEGEWEPLIDRNLWEQVRARRLVSKKETASSNRTGTGANVLSRILFCSCGAAMWRSTSSDPKRSSYDCSKASAKRRGDCPYGGVGAERVERIVRTAFLERMSGPHRETVSALRIREPSPPDSSKKRKALERRMERLVELQIESTAPAATTMFRKKLESIEAELMKIDLEGAEQTIGAADASQRAERVNTLREMASDLSLVWENATSPERNSMLRLVIERVVVGIGERPKPIEITWPEWLAT